MNYGHGNELTPFRGRKPDIRKPVYIYRNLSAKSDAMKYSVRQNGLVVAHTNQLMLSNCRFIISKIGQAKVRRNKRKIVHAFIKGYIATEGGMGIDASDKRTLPVDITYNPYTDDTFISTNLSRHPEKLSGAGCVIIKNTCITAEHIYYYERS